MSKMTITCSCCGYRSKTFSRDPMFAVELVDEGWGSCGSALYCPKCTESWTERNGNRKMADYDSTVLTIVSRMLDDAEAEIRCLKEEIINETD